MDSLEAVGILERDTNGGVLITWLYPRVDNELQKVLTAHSCLAEEDAPETGQFLFSRYANTWHYVLTRSNEGNPRLPSVSSFGVFLIAKVFNPERYGALLRILWAVYAESGDASDVLQAYLSVFTRGEVDVKGLGSFRNEDYDDRRAFLVTSLKDIIRLFGVESIMLWHALLLKKRVVVYCDRPQDLVRFLRGLPLFVWHRQNWAILRPFVTNSPTELEELRASGVYAAGFIIPSVRNREDLFDILVDVPARTITVADHARGDFALGAYHREMAQFLVDSAAEEGDHLALIKGLTMKTRELLTNLDKWRVEGKGGKHVVTLDSLEQRRLPAHMDRFLYNVALAEGMTE